MNHVVRQWGGEMPTRSHPSPFSSPALLPPGVLTATDKSFTLVSQLSQSSGEWAWWGFGQWRNFACFLYVCLPPPTPLPSFSEPFLLFEGGEMLCSAVFVSVVHQKKALCVQGFTVSVARKGKGSSLFDVFFPHAPLAGRCTWKIKDNSDPPFCLFFFQRSVSIWELYFWGLLTFCCVQGQCFCMAIPQNGATNKRICVVHTVCMIKAFSQECLSLALFSLPV